MLAKRTSIVRGKGEGDRLSFCLADANIRHVCRGGAELCAIGIQKFANDKKENKFAATDISR